MAVGQFDLGPAAAFSVIYFLFTLLFCWLFYVGVARSHDE
jgi:glycerol transport system permease protein